MKTKEVVERLRSNSIQELRIAEDTPESDWGEILSALQANTSLKQLGVFGLKLTRQCLKVLENNTTLEKFSSNGAYPWTETLAAVESEVISFLKANQSLKSLFIGAVYSSDAFEKIVTEGLKYNKALESLAIDEWKPTINYIFETTISDALTENFSIKKIRIGLGPGHPNIATSITRRNQRFADMANETYLSLVNESVTIPDLVENIQTMENVLKDTFGGFKYDPSAYFPIYRLFTLVRDTMSDSERLLKALNAFNLKFSNPEFQKIFERYLGKALSSFPRSLSLNPKATRAMHRLTLFCLRDVIDNPIYLNPIKTSFLALNKPEQIISLYDIQLDLDKISEVDQLILYDTARDIALSALSGLDPELEDAKNLMAWLQKNSYDPSMGRLIWENKSFIEQLKSRYPQKNSFQILEHYLLESWFHDQNSNGSAFPKQKYVLGQKYNTQDVFLDNLNVSAMLDHDIQETRNVLIAQNSEKLLRVVKENLNSIFEATKRTPLFFGSPQERSSNLVVVKEVYQKLLDHFRDDSVISLLIVMALMQSNLTLPRMIKKDIINEWLLGFSGESKEEAWERFRVDFLSEQRPEVIDLVFRLSQPLAEIANGKTTEVIVQNFIQQLSDFSPSTPKIND